MSASLGQPPRGAPSPKEGTIETSLIGHRLRVVQAVVLTLFVALVTALGYWQIARSDTLVEVGRRQALRRQVIPATRGTIYDRNHRVLAENWIKVSAVLDLGRVRIEIQHEKAAIARHDAHDGGRARERVGSPFDARARLAVVERHQTRIAAVVGRAAAIDGVGLERHFRNDRSAPFTLLDDLTEEESARLSVALGPDDPVRIERATQRTYPNGHAAAHVIGRVRRDRTREPGAEDMPTLNVMAERGDSGIEQQHDFRLAGRAGARVVRLDAAGYIAGSALEERDSIPGEDVVLSIDLDLQRVAERAMADTPGVPRGGAVAIAVATGEILAMASLPDFDLNAVSPRISLATKQRIDAESGWLNRATQALYPPGSSFKIFTALAGLRRGTLQPETRYDCPGFLAVGGHRFVCHVAEGHGSVALRTGLALSCNVFAYQAGLAAGPAALAAEARRFHFHEPTAVDLPFETSGMIVPDPGWKAESGCGAWTTGDTVNLSIGQGFLRFSPLQAACAMASLARRETLTVPTLLRQPGRRPSGSLPPEPLGLDARAHEALIAGMRAVVEIGIGRNAHVPGVSLVGKSGTAQVMREEGMKNVAWFVAFAPMDRPEIALAVAMEGDAPNEEFAGAAHAAPIVGLIASAYFEKKARR